MKNRIIMSFLSIILYLLQAPVQPAQGNAEPPSFISRGTVEKTCAAIAEKSGSKDLAAIRKGVSQAALYWRECDGTEQQFIEFCCTFFVADQQERRRLMDRFESNLESINGHLHEISRHINEPLQLDRGPIMPVDNLFGEFSPYAHLMDDYFKTKIAFVVLLNFPIHTLNEQLTEGAEWSRSQWAASRLADNFKTRVPAEVNQKATVAFTGAENYISSYNICMHNLLTPDGKRLFPEGKKLISHWGIRDELKAQYREKDGTARQEMIVSVMERIIRQEIPAQVINNPRVDWDPVRNKVFSEGKEIAVEREKDVRYHHLKEIFKAEELIDACIPACPSHIRRSFEWEREIPEKALESMLVELMTSPVIKKTAAIIEKRLGRSIRPYDIWYNGFRSATPIPESELDRIVSARYPDLASFQRDLPAILCKLGFSKERAQFLSKRIEVDPARGSGHAMGAGRRGDKAHLRTRLTDGHFNYKGFNIALHELGHTVEQTFSLYCVDNNLLAGVPNIAITEAFAFVFQARDLEVLGVTQPDPMKEHIDALGTLWDSYELGGVALVDMKVWHWMYDHPQATESELKEGVIACAKDVWNRYYAPVFGRKDVILFAIYSHMIDSSLYLPNYPVGHIIQFQMEDYLRRKGLDKEMERMCSCGRVAPDLWMRHALGAPISVKPLLSACEKAAKALEGQEQKACTKRIHQP